MPNHEMTRREFTLGIAAPMAARAQSPLRAAAFRADVTPAPGEPLIWVDPTREVLDPLWANGVILEGPGGRVVLCAVDWCGLGGSVHRMFRDRLARAAGAAPGHVALLAVHQHTAPYAEGGAYEFMARLDKPPLIMSQAFLETVTGRVAEAAARAANNLQPFDTIGLGAAHPERIASARRIHAGGKLITRFSTGGKDPALAALPEGDVDTRLRTVTLLQRNRPLVRLHYYACHPQTFCCTGEVSADFVGTARETIEREEGVPQVYFTGCAGDVTAGKYNDGSPEARGQLAKRLEAGLRASIKSTASKPVRGMNWRTAVLELPGPAGPKPEWPPAGAASMSGTDIYRRAIRAAFAARRETLTASCLTLGGIRLVHLPGEPMLDFQRHAPDAIVAGYGDISPGYLCPDRAFAEGGYEPSAANTGPGAEAVIKQTITDLLSG